MRVLDVDDAVERRVREERDTGPFDGDVAFLRTVGQDEPDAVSFGHDPDARARVEPPRRAVGLREETPPPARSRRSPFECTDGSRGPYRSGPPRQSTTIRDVRFRLTGQWELGSFRNYHERRGRKPPPAGARGTRRLDAGPRGAGARSELLDADVRQPQQGSRVQAPARVDGVTTHLKLPLAGPGGEPVDLWRTMNSHGFAELAPTRLDEEARTLELTLRIRRGKPRRVRIREGSPRRAAVEILGPPAGYYVQDDVVAGVRHVLRLDHDLSGFYAKAHGDPDLAWASTGAGRMLQGPSVFEDVVKTVCTTNCTWGATVRMVERARRSTSATRRSAGGIRSRTPSRRPDRMAEAPESFYRDVARAGYRGAYLRSLARSVANGDLDLEALASAAPDELPDAELEQRLLALPGVGPYAAAHIMMTIGRNSLTDPRFMDPSQVRTADGKEDRDRRADPPAVRAVRRPRRPRVLVVRDPRLGRPEEVVRAFLAGHTARDLRVTRPA